MENGQFTTSFIDFIFFLTTQWRLFYLLPFLLKFERTWWWSHEVSLIHQQQIRKFRYNVKMQNVLKTQHFCLFTVFYVTDSFRWNVRNLSYTKLISKPNQVQCFGLHCCMSKGVNKINRIGHEVSNPSKRFWGCIVVSLVMDETFP